MNYKTPLGFRDILPQEARARELATRLVQDLFDSYGYDPIETPTLENQELMRAAGYRSSSPFKFFDAQGNLLIMRPDVTMQVARMCGSRLANSCEPLRFRYTQRIFRESDDVITSDPREMTQMGVECIGEDGIKADAEVISLFIQAMRVLGVRNFTLSVACVGVLNALLDYCDVPDSWKAALLEAFHASNFVELDRLCEEYAGRVEPVSAIQALARIRGGVEAIEQARELLKPYQIASADLDALEATISLLIEEGFEHYVRVDFSVMSSFDYYTGMVFEAYAPGVGSPLGSGGRYDHMLSVFGADRPAAGFAFFLEQAMYAAEQDKCTPEQDRPLRIAVPKGSLNPDSIEALAASGLDVSGLDNPGRLLVISNPGVEYVIVRPSDAPVFVALGAADCGICGKDSLLEAQSDCVELVDLGFGACRFIVAEPAKSAHVVDKLVEQRGFLRVATKYPHITQWFYDKCGVQVEIVQLHGNIELAPLTGLAERIVDITATGTTLKENNLVVVDEVLSSTARFIANPCAFRTKSAIRSLALKLKAHAQVTRYEPIAGASQPTFTQNANNSNKSSE
ncbi:ATP phosphoribosyltransferase regulatory subunit [Eggerthellaceae bacterium 3-80]|nr:ATP phosphoribosyltransferase regulatory subunit [bacterium D16-34]